nr:MAG: DNA pilot protein [Microvirus sp.]
MGIIDGILGAGASIFNSAQQAKVARQNTERTIQAQKDLAEYSYSKDLEMWNKANEYNAPSQQMSRLTEAGLNPNMVYGSGTVVGNTSTQTPKYQAYNPQFNNKAVELPNLLNVLSMFQDVRIKKAQVDNLSEEVLSKRISNMFLDKKLTWQTDLLEKEARRAGIDLMRPSDDAVINTMRGRSMTAELDRTQASALQQKLDAQLKQLDINLAGKGINRSDNMLLRMLIQSGLFDQARNFLQKKQ